MGARCAKFCFPHLPDLRREQQPTKAGLGAVLTRRRQSRVSPLRYRSDPVKQTRYFDEGFALGIRVGKLQRFLEALEVADKGGAQVSVAPGAREDPEGSKLGSDESCATVIVDGNVPEKVEDDTFQIMRQAEPHNSLQAQLQKDFKPWLQVPGHFEFKSHASLP